MTPTGELIAAIDLADVCEEFSSGKFSFDGILPRSDGKACVVFRTPDKSEYEYYLFDDLVSGVREGTRLRNSLRGSLIRVNESTAYFQSAYGVYSVGADGSVSEVFNFTDLNIGGDMFGFSIAFESADRIYMLYMDDTTTTPYFVRADLTETPPDAGMTVLRVAYEESGDVSVRPLATSNILSTVSRFNRESENCRIKLVPYITDDISTANEKLYRDIISGKMPDLIFFGGTLDSEPFLKTGALVDLYEYIDADEKFTREAFLPCVLEPFEKGGKLSELVLSLHFRTFIGASDVVGDRKSFSVDDFAEMVGALGNGRYVTKFDESTSPQYDLFAEMLPFILDEYVDSAKKECHFGDSFRKLLETCKSSPVKVVKGNLAPEYYRSGDVLFEKFDIDTFIFFMAFRFRKFTDAETSMLGAPRSDGKPIGTAMYNDLSVSMTKDCRDMALAWDFIKFYLEDGAELWENLRETPGLSHKSGGIVPTREVSEKIFDIIEDCVWYTLLKPTQLENGDEGVVVKMEVQTMFDVPEDLDLGNADAVKAYREKTARNGETDESARVFRYHSFVFQKGYYPVRFTEADREAFSDLFENCTAVWSKNGAVKGIILEEVSSYFAGTRSLDDTLKYINDRVKTKLAE